MVTKKIPSVNNHVPWNFNKTPEIASGPVHSSLYSYVKINILLKLKVSISYEAAIFLLGTYLEMHEMIEMHELVCILQHIRMNVYYSFICTIDSQQSKSWWMNCENSTNIFFNGKHPYNIQYSHLGQKQDCNNGETSFAAGCWNNGISTEK